MGAEVARPGRREPFRRGAIDMQPRTWNGLAARRTVAMPHQRAPRSEARRVLQAQLAAVGCVRWLGVASTRPLPLTPRREKSNTQWEISPPARGRSNLHRKGFIASGGAALSGIAQDPNATPKATRSTSTTPDARLTFPLTPSRLQHGRGLEGNRENRRTSSTPAPAGCNRAAARMPSARAAAFCGCSGGNSERSLPP